MPPALARAIRWLAGPGRTPALIVGIAAAFGSVWLLVWRLVGPDVRASEAYLLTPEAVEITPVPEWIHKQAQDICREVFQDASLDNQRLSILDDGLVDKLKTAFASNPWVAQVGLVRKHYPARVTVDLVYRRPVCVVEIGSERHPVDAEGVLLPGEDLSVTEAARYPRLVGIESRSAAVLGRPWNDPRVGGGAEIADAFGPHWEPLRLELIVPLDPARAGRGRECMYELVTRQGTRVFWGGAPSSAVPGEPTAQEKVGKLRKYAAEHGTLEGTRGPQRLDLTRPGVIDGP